MGADVVTDLYEQECAERAARFAAQQRMFREWREEKKAAQVAAAQAAEDLLRKAINAVGADKIHDLLGQTHLVGWIHMDRQWRPATTEPPERWHRSVLVDLAGRMLGGVEWRTKDPVAAAGWVEGCTTTADTDGVWADGEVCGALVDLRGTLAGILAQLQERVEAAGFKLLPPTPTG